MDTCFIFSHVAEQKKRIGVSRTRATQHGEDSPLKVFGKAERQQSALKIEPYHTDWQ